ncbi:MAG: lysoplasmalogenase [Treponema sp.]|jgi:uncharacterized membrane protein YhhN|nr:lysoplasmalogenase [Treponema sp.]
MEKILWIIFGAVSVLHLVSILLNRRHLRSISKVCLIPVLVVIYSTAAGVFQATALLALIFGWGGDTLLLNGKHLRFFLLGLSSFLAGHLCYAATMLIRAGRIEGLVLVLSVIAAFPLVYLVYRIIKPSKVMKIPVLVYEAVIVLMSISCLQLFAARRDTAAALIFGGSLFFLFSDALLGYDRFRKKLKYGNFLVMLSYIIAQGGIVAGLCTL